MEASLHLRVNGYNIAAALFYVFYAAFEVGGQIIFSHALSLTPKFRCLPIVRGLFREMPTPTYASLTRSAHEENWASSMV